MTKNNRIKIGDIFKTNTQNGIIRYLQFVMIDPGELNSEVIRIFNYEGRVDEKIDYEKVFFSGISCYTHVVIKWGIKLYNWEKVCNIPIEIGFVPPFFRDVKLKDEYIVNGKLQFCKTDNWYSWQAGERFEERKHIGWLTEETEKYYLGGVVPPKEIQELINDKNSLKPYFT